MFNIKLAWKSFNVNLTEVESWIRSNAGDNYAGNTSAAELTLWYLEEPAQEIKDSIQTYWDELTEESAEATTYISSASINEAIQTLKEGLLAKDWADMSQAERKLILGMTPSREELGL